MPPIASRLALQEAERVNKERGHEVGGFVSSSRGFVPIRPPATSMPPSHAAWDELAADLPSLYQRVGIRDALRSMPVLPADEASLADEHLLRAATLMAIFGHAWVRIEIADDGEIPPPVWAPWTQVARRMGRGDEPFMQYNDLILTNWRMRDPAASDPLAIENLELLVPTVGNQTEQVFYLTQVEMTAHAAPLVEAAVRAQEAMTEDDAAGFKEQLLVMLDVVRSLVERSFVKIDPNPLAYSHCDPVIWGTTVAPFGVSLSERHPGPGGTASPVFHLMDAFLGRKDYSSQLGHESSSLRVVAPPLQQEFIKSISSVDLAAFLVRMKSPALNGLVQTVGEAYAGDHGLIAAHRLKAYGFLEVAFKVGRSVTIGGFKGVFRDRPWKLVDSELNITRMERALGSAAASHTASVAVRSAPVEGVATVSFDVADRGIVYSPGDRCGVLPVNDPSLVERTLAALDTPGSAMIPLTPLWVDALRLRRGFEDSTSLALSDFLRFAKLRPVLRSTAKALHAASASPLLEEIIEARAEDQWELWDLLELLHDDGYDVSRLCSAEVWQAEALAQVVPPETFRMYSVSSAPDADADGLPQTMDLTVGQLAYESGGIERLGTASTFLGRTAAGDVPVRIVHPRRFRLPDDPTRPIVMFAAGTGIAPFRGFMRERTAEQESWLFVAARNESQLLYMDEVRALETAGRLSVRTALSQETRLEEVMRQPEEAALLRALIAERGAVVYLCGRPGFASSVLDTLSELAGRDEVRQMVADRRLMMDIFTAFAPAAAQRSADAGVFDASEIVLHNEEERGYWIVVDGMVYDMSEFVHLHPGGKKILVESAGMDASREYKAVLHHENSEIEAMLSMYKMGSVRRLRFGGEWGVVLTPDGFEYLSLADAYTTWVRFLYLVVEMQNAFVNDVSYLTMPTVRDEPADLLTPYKLMLFGNTHLRFFDHYFRGSLGDDVKELWRIVTGLCAPDEPLRAMDDALTAVFGGDAAARVDRFGERLRLLYQSARGVGLDDAAYWAGMGAVVDAVVAADGAFLQSMKLALREGVRVFEQHESETAKVGGPALVEVLLAVPPLATAYFDDLIARVESIDPTLIA